MTCCGGTRGRRRGGTPTRPWWSWTPRASTRRRAVPAGTTGKDAGKRVPGRKRGLAVDVLGLVIAVVVLAASAHENAAGTALLDKVAAQRPAR